MNVLHLQDMNIDFSVPLSIYKVGTNKMSVLNTKNLKLYS